MKTSEEIKKAIESVASDLNKAEFFDTAEIKSTQTTNLQNSIIANLLRTNQYLLGDLVDNANLAKRDMSLIKEHLLNLNREQEKLKSEIQIIRSKFDGESSEKFNCTELSKEVQTLSKSLEEAQKAKNPLPNFGWTRRDKKDWLA